MDRRDFLKLTGSASLAAGVPFTVWPLHGTTRLGDHGVPSGDPGTVLSLGGEWSFRLDPENVGREFEAWYDRDLSDVIPLPGSTDEASFGTRTTGPEFGHLSREWRYEGACWYQRSIEIPDEWRGKRVTLFLERPHWMTTVWVGSEEVGAQNSLSVPHVYDLTDHLAPGVRRLTIRVDNTYAIDVGRNAHSVTDHTQTNWNGIVGRIELRATDPVWIDDLQVYPNVERGTARVTGSVRNATGRRLAGRLALTARAEDERAEHTTTENLRRLGAETSFSVELDLEDAERWDEYESHLYVLDAVLTTEEGQFVDRRQEAFGMRALGTSEGRITLNGRPIFLRGTLECCIFPETGYPPTDVAAWSRLFEIAGSYGLNHFRFHSWCPPEAAFVAADRVGFLLQVELPVWSHEVGEDEELDAFMRAEAERIQRVYGNHPSFAMMALGNELLGDWSFINGLLEEMKERDPRRLYTTHADHRRMAPEPSSEFYVTHHTDKGYLRLHGNERLKERLGTDYDFADLVEGIEVPTLAHEIGQWVVNPDYKRLDRYTGPLKPRNLEAFRDALDERGMLDQAEDFRDVTGRLSWLLYKEDIESTLRTPDFGGMQLLQLQDFPGQGEALIGLIDAFWESKGIHSPAQFRQFCSPTVPLLRMEKFVWTTDETFTATLQVHHYGKAPLTDSVATWAIEDDAGATLASGATEPTDVPLGVTSLRIIEVPLESVREATHFTVRLSIPAASATNRWDLWVYPAEGPTEASGDVLIAERYDHDVRDALARGRRVLILSPPSETSEHAIASRFLPVFWSLSWFANQPGTSSILCDPAHPALAAFPTDRHTNWQWQEILEPSKAFVMDETPAHVRPMIQVVDDYHRNHKLGAVFETRVGPGRLLACGLNLEDNGNRPVARQMRRSLLRYMQSDAFQPSHALSPALLERWLA